MKQPGHGRVKMVNSCWQGSGGPPEWGRCALPGGSTGQMGTCQVRMLQFPPPLPSERGTSTNIAVTVTEALNALSHSSSPKWGGRSLIPWYILRCYVTSLSSLVSNSCDSKPRLFDVQVSVLSILPCHRKPTHMQISFQQVLNTTKYSFFRFTHRHRFSPLTPPT